MRKRVKISEARAKLFDLVDYVTGAPDRVVVIEHRDRKERVALVSEERLRYLEVAAEASRKRSERFKLAGSVKRLVSPEELEAAIEEDRREQARLSAKKFEDL